VRARQNFPRTIIYHESEISAEKEAYIQRLLEEKPWLDRGILQWYKFEGLKENFPLLVQKNFHQNY